MGGDILEHLVEGLGLDLLAFKLCAGIVEIKKDATLVEFFDEQLGAFVGWCFWMGNVSTWDENTSKTDP